MPKEGFEPTHPCGYYVLNVARLPFRHFGTICGLSTFPVRSGVRRPFYPQNRHPVDWAVEDLNLGPLACEASALTAELTARVEGHVNVGRDDLGALYC